MKPRYIQTYRLFNKDNNTILNMLNNLKISKFAPNNLSLLTKQYRDRKSINHNKCSIYCISDLHLEFYPHYLTLWNDIKYHLPDADVLVLAGDIGIPTGDAFIQYGQLLKMFKTRYSNIILVPGNHEYYQAQNYNRELVLDNLKKLCEQCRIILLNNSSIIINDVKFIGTTLWSEMHPNAKINDIGKVFPSVVEYNEEFLKCKNWLKSELDETDKGDNEMRCVVITHHLPTSKLIHPTFEKYSELNTAFCTDVLDEMNLSKVDLWFCGHTHESSIYEHELNNHKTRFVVNPYGYPSELRDTYTTSDIYEVVKANQHHNNNN